jgi:hypothetical protein
MKPRIEAAMGRPRAVPTLDFLARSKRALDNITLSPVSADQRRFGKCRTGRLVLGMRMTRMSSIADVVDRAGRDLT